MHQFPGGFRKYHYNDSQLSDECCGITQPYTEDLPHYRAEEFYDIEPAEIVEQDYDNYSGFAYPAEKIKTPEWDYHFRGKFKINYRGIPY